MQQALHNSYSRIAHLYGMHMNAGDNQGRIMAGDVKELEETMQGT
jgi:hypothetical protein